MTAKSWLIVQHMDWEGPGEHLRAALTKAEISYRVLEAWREAVPPLSQVAGLIVLGGAPNVDEEDAYPYLKPLKEKIAEALRLGLPYLGFCLGHQLLGHMLGCRVGPLPQKSVGFITAELTPAGKNHPAFQGLEARMPLFKWHGQGVLPPLPAGLDILAASEVAPVEALGPADRPQVLGLQFDNHAGVSDVVQWLHHDATWAVGGSKADIEAITAAARRQAGDIGRWFSRFMENYLTLARRLI